MANSLEGKAASLWSETTPRTNYPQLTDDNKLYDLVIIGGGITGITAAYFAAKRGLKTALIEKSRLVEWTTGGTTAKLTSQHYLIYDYLIKHQGEDTANAFADANQRGIDTIEQLSNELDIDSMFVRRPAYVYTNDPVKTDSFKAEVEAAKSLGLPASFETTTELPFEVTVAVKFTNQGQFHPRKFLLGLAEEFIELGGTIYEHTKATDIKPGDEATVVTEQGNLKAKHILQASGEPFYQGEMLADSMWTKMSYALAVTLKDDAYPEGMYITTDEPMRTISTSYYHDQPVMIFGGESHEFDAATFDKDLHHKNLIDDVRTKFNVDKILFRWLAGDNMPYDRMPYIGSLPDQPNIYISTGYRAWGLAWAVSATKAVVGDIIGEPDDWVKPFSLERLKNPIDKKDKSIS